MLTRKLCTSQIPQERNATNSHVRESNVTSKYVRESNATTKYLQESNVKVKCLRESNATNNYIRKAMPQVNTYEKAMPQLDSTNFRQGVTMNIKIRTMVGTIVRGPINLTSRPIIPVKPSRACTTPAIMRLPCN